MTEKGKVRVAKFPLVVLSGCASLLAPLLLSGQDCTNRPPCPDCNTSAGLARYWPVYAQWCTRCGGTISGNQCIPGSNWGGRSDYTPPPSGPTGTPPRTTGPSREEIDRQQFEAEKQELLNTLKDIRPTALGEPRGEKRDTGIKILPPETDYRDVSTAWKQLHCASYLAQKAAAAYLRNDRDELAYLTEQSAHALSGGTLGVTCPAAPPLTVPDRKGSEFELYEILLKSTREATSRLVEAEQQIPQLTQRKHQASQGLAERRTEVRKLQAEIRTNTDPAKKRQKQGELDDLERLLREAQQLNNEATRLLNQAQADRQHGQQTLERNGDIFEKAKNNPDSVPQLLEQVRRSSQPPPAGLPQTRKP